MKWFDSWLQKRIVNASLKEPEWWKQLGFVRQTASGQSVTIDNSLKVSAVYGCVRIISEALASLPLKIYETTPDGKVVADHPLNKVFKLPNGIQTGFEMREFIGTSLTMRGNSYGQKIRTGRGQIAEIVPLYPQHMNPDKTASGRLIFDYQEPGAARVFEQDQIWRIAGMGSNGVIGLSPIALARESIGLAMALEEHGATLFKNGTQTDAVFEIPTELSEEAFDRLKAQLAGHQGSANSHKALILEGGLVRKDIGMTAEDSQFIATRKLQIADIARFYRVPLHMLNELDKATFSNIEHQSIEFVRDTLTPWLVRIEESIYRDLLTEQERKRYYAKHSVDGILRGDVKSRNEAFKIGVDGGWLNGNEVRELSDMNRADGLDEYRSQLNTASTEERRRMENSQTAVISDLVEREANVLSKDKNSEMLHFVDFYNRHLTKGAAMLGIDKKQLIPYGQKRLQEIEAGISDDYIAQVMGTGADDMRGFLQ